MKQIILVISFMCIGSLKLMAQDVWMHPNAGQWDDRIEYKVELDLGEMYIEKDGFTYNLSDINTKHSHDHELKAHDEANDVAKSHVIKSKFLGSNWGGEVVEANASEFYRNYIQGNDKSKWKGKIHSYNKLSMSNFYSGIDLILDGSRGGLKYSFEVAPNVDVNQIVMNYSGQDRLYLDELGNLHVANRFGEIIEEAPKAWLDESGRKVEVEFRIKGENVTFYFPDGYDQSRTLIIDPTLTFSTFTGGTADNWGMSATPDSNGNLAAGGTIRGLGYPVTVGAFDTTFNLGLVDAVITKFTSDGGSLVFSTYLGGSGDETVNSMISGQNDDLYIFGLTSSTNFPLTGTPYDASFNGGPNVSSTSNSLGFGAGSDLYIVRLTSDGTTLINSTYVGGSGTDGLNNLGLNYNYGDQFRGEIILDDNGFVYVSSNTQSANFPTVLGTQGALSGTQDAVVFKMSANLSTMIWSTFFGGSGIETGNSVQIGDNGDVFIAGGTTSSSMPFNIGYDLTYDGGSDAYIARFNGANGSILSGTYIGLTEYDQAYFVQLDIDDNVYVLGQTESDLGITPGKYGTPNSGQFIWKFDHNLASPQWKTMIGGGTGHVEISPTAFLVSDCYDIYLSGWGGHLNVLYASSIYSTVNGFQTTPGAFQTVSNGENFYIAVLDDDATSLKYATFFGGTANVSAQHVDGGTSRFDKSGRIYHAVCGGCGAHSNGFTTTPGAWSQINGSNNCNMAAFKFELSTVEALITTPDPIVCLPDPVIFNNNSANGNAFFWDFGDNTYSNLINPTHLYAGPGNYTVTLVVTDTNECFSSDSIEFLIIIGDFNGGVVTPPGSICPGDSYQLEAFGGVDYLWTPALNLDDPTIANPTATLTQTTDFMVIISDSCGIDTAYVTVPVYIGTASISNDTSICIGNDVQLFAMGGVSYEWTPSNFLDDPFSSTPISTPANDIQYFVEITTSTGCVLSDTVFIDVYYTPPVPIMPEELSICENTSIEITVSGAQTYHWYPNSSISFVDTNLVIVNPPNDITYYCDFTNACGSVTDSVFIDVITSNIIAGFDTIICPGETATLWAQGGISYIWSPYQSLNNTSSSSVYATPSAPTTYYVVGTDIHGCSDTASVYVGLFPQPFIQTSPDVYAFYGDNVELSATSSTPGPYVWYPTEFLSCVVCPEPIANPNQNYTYFVTYTDVNGCTAGDSVHIYYDPILWVPNTFTPGDDSHNPFFKAEGGNIKTFEMLIFNRWGELICTLNEIEEFWDGTYEGAKCQDGTYVWKLKLTDFDDEERILSGHVNLLR